MGQSRKKVAVITGGASGIGAACARRLVAEGAHVVLADITPRAEELSEELGERARSVELDVADEDGWQRVVSETEEAFGPITTLVNGAGVVHRCRFEELSLDDYTRVINVNQVGVFLGMRAVLPSMRRGGGGSIVNISSVDGMIAHPEILGYVASKWAVRGMTKSVAQELGPEGIRVNSVHPGPIDTPMIAGKEGPAQMAQGTPLRRMGDPEEVAAVVSFLADDASSYCTASEFVVDGGYTSL
ncbi:SDR family oxidoreductase [Nocardiopsis sp. HNM0947]|uniref:SDR family oxidoreductase n=1 Tax=Nocardiopsis coralli TaxID=2772213 RepID=A0ABR9PA78_9ACTN|nr:glucose 1-dehydrogenase [Nocardiopsis coralli]MBE3000739.1 SDR family oxidoreductase [Nocardiopsis coralli]